MKKEIQLIELKEITFGIMALDFIGTVMLEDLEKHITSPHRHDHYCCFFVESGHLNFNVDFQNIDVPASSLLVTTPGQVHELGSSRDLQGWIIVFDAKFVDENARDIIERSFAKIILLNLEPDDELWFSGLMKLIDASQSEAAPHHFHRQLMQNLFNAFFYKTVGIFQSQEDKRIREYSSRNVEIAKKFHQLVKEHYLVLKKPADYAAKLNITVSYLNDTVKSVTGFPSTYFIQREIFREAQRLLSYTDKSVKEIAFQLGYEDYKYFIRLFSKTTGTSPTNFRKNIQ